MLQRTARWAGWSARRSGSPCPVRPGGPTCGPPSRTSPAPARPPTCPASQTRFNRTGPPQPRCRILTGGGLSSLLLRTRSAISSAADRDHTVKRRHHCAPPRTGPSTANADRSRWDQQDASGDAGCDRTARCELLDAQHRWLGSNRPPPGCKCGGSPCAAASRAVIWRSDFDVNPPSSAPPQAHRRLSHREQAHSAQQPVPTDPLHRGRSEPAAARP
jgi:hypothetical protein